MYISHLKDVYLVLKVFFLSFIFLSNSTLADTKIEIPLLVVAHALYKDKFLQKTVSNNYKYSEFKKIIEEANKMLVTQNIRLSLYEDKIHWYRFELIETQLSVGKTTLNIPIECSDEFTNEKLIQMIDFSKLMSEGIADRILWGYDSSNMLQLLRIVTNSSLVNKSKPYYQSPLLVALSSADKVTSYSSTTSLDELKKAADEGGVVGLMLQTLKGAKKVDSQSVGYQSSADCGFDPSVLSLDTSNILRLKEDDFIRKGIVLTPIGLNSNRKEIAETLIHEIGHYYGLPHNFQFQKNNPQSCASHIKFYKKNGYFNDVDYEEGKIGDTIPFVYDEKYQIVGNCYNEVVKQIKGQWKNPKFGIMSYDKPAPPLFSPDQLNKIKLLSEMFKQEDDLHKK